MSYMFEVYYEAPPDPAREEGVARMVSRLGGSPSYREMPDGGGADASPVCLTFEFPEWESAQAAADSLRRRGEHVEGTVSYGP